MALKKNLILPFLLHETPLPGRKIYGCLTCVGAAVWPVCVCVCVCACVYVCVYARACVYVWLTRTSSFSESNIIVLDWGV